MVKTQRVVGYLLLAATTCITALDGSIKYWVSLAVFSSGLIFDFVAAQNKAVPNSIARNSQKKKSIARNSFMVEEPES